MGEVAFAIMAHADPDMTRRLCAELQGHPIVLHVDATSDITPFQDIPGVRLVQDRVDVRWGGWSEVEAVLRLYRDCLDELGDRQDAHVALLSGADFPVRPLQEFFDYLDAVPWTEHVRAINVLDGSSYMENKIRRHHLFDRFPVGGPRNRARKNGAIRRIAALVLPRRPIEDFAPLRPVWGSTWTVLSRACLEDVLPIAHDEHVQSLFRETQTPLEMLFPTLVHSHHSWWRSTEYGPEPRAGRWPGEFNNVHYIHPSLGVWLDASYAQEIVDSGGFFARKISSTKVDEVMAAIAAVKGTPAASRLRPDPSTLAPVS